VKGAIALGTLAALGCYLAINLKSKLGYDDTLDAFGIHGVGGIIGALLTGVFAAPMLGGGGIYDYIKDAASADYSIAGQVMTQAIGVGVTIVWCAIVSLIALKIVDAIVGLRVSEEVEREGLDVNEHGETAYHM